MKSFSPYLAAVALLGALASPFASAQTVVSWSLAGKAGNQATEAASFSAANVVGGNITRGGGLTTSAATNSFSSAGWEAAAAAPGSTEYLSFAFTVATGYALNLDRLYIGTRSSGTGPGTLGLFYSGDGFASSLYTFTQPDSTFVNSSIDLSALPDLAGAISFRLYEIGNASATGGVTGSGGTFRVTDYFSGSPSVFDRNLQFTGTVTAVPEPSSVALMLAGLLAAGVAGRRFSRASSSRPQRG